MSTEFSSIYRIFLYTIQDYKIKNMFLSDANIAEDMFEVWLIKTVPKFYNCAKNLNDIDLTTKKFNIDLDLSEQAIIVDGMVISWMDWVINDILQMNISLTENDFKHYAEEKNLREKSIYADKLRERFSQSLVDYGLQHTPFSQWAVGNFGL